MFDLNKILRKHIGNLVPHFPERNELEKQERIFLDANENSFGSPLIKNYNRYPDPLQLDLKGKLSKIKGVPVENIFLGNGNTEAIDILLRAFCNPGKDNVIICPPAYEIYEISAKINDVEVRKVNLTENFQLDIEAISEVIDENSKVMFICSPNDPTGNSINREDIEIVLNNFEGIVVIDEAYINFAKQKTLTSELTEYPNLVILQTLSKAWGLAGLRIGFAFASQQMIDIFNKIKPLYNVNTASQQLAFEALNEIAKVNTWIKEIVSERERLIDELKKLNCVSRIFPSDANFILVKVIDAEKVYSHLTKNSIIVNDQSKIPFCEGCLRITIGKKDENDKLIELLQKFRVPAD